MLKIDEVSDKNNVLVNEQYYQAECEEQDVSPYIEKSITSAYHAKLAIEHAIRKLEKSGFDYIEKVSPVVETEKIQIDTTHIFQEIQSLIEKLINLKNNLPIDEYDAEIQMQMLQTLQAIRCLLANVENITTEMTAEVSSLEKLLYKKRAVLRDLTQSLEKTKTVTSNIEKVIHVIQKDETPIERAQRLNDGTMVTVVCITYNHEKYLAEALDSFLMQKTNFKFKVFVGEDCSTDGTRKILQSYAERYPEIIIPFYREKNMGALKNTYDLLMHLTSPFVAYCEGDDYWTDECKLQKQYDLMQEKPYLRACFHNTEMLNNRGFANGWFLPDEDGRILMPSSYPTFNKNIREFDANYYIKTAPAHTSSMFFRWNYEITIPKEFVRYPSGDHYMMMIQLGKGKIGFIPDIMSVYRRNDTGITWAGGDNNQRWLQTREDWVYMTCVERNYFKEYYESFAIVSIENRMKLEAYNYFDSVIKSGRYDKLADFFSKYPEAARIALNAYMVFYQDSRLLTGCYSWEGYKLLVRNRWVRNSIKFYIKFLLKCNQLKINLKQNKILKTSYKKVAGLRSLIKYWVNAFVPKKKNLWVFSTLQKKDYIDNTKYLYEYITEYHPEIEAVWLTQDDLVIKKLAQQGKKVYKMSSKKGKKIMKQASIAVIDHYRVTDLENNFGFNARTKVVQLWHGVGLKDMKRIIEISSYKKKGLVFSDDILPKENDTFLERVYKKLKYFRYAHRRELFEDYFMLLCPGQEHIDKVADVYHLPHDRCFLCGHPRNINLYTGKLNMIELKVIYAPTLRNYADGDFLMVNNCANAFDEIQHSMEKINGQFIIRLHPYTFHNFQYILMENIERYDRINIDTSRDIYESLGSYSVMISDYSSIAFDFIMLDRPVVFHCPDLEEYLSNDNGIAYDFAQVTPGPKTKSWQETLNAVEEYVVNPNKDSEWRKEVGKYFFDPNVNDENNSERIVCEIKRRLGLMN